MERQHAGHNVQIYILSAVIALVQVFDIVVHVANDMIEPIRIVSNVFLFVWLGIVLSGRLNQMVWRVMGGFVGVYAVLNIIFLAENGLTNPDNNDEFRTILFVLVGVTIALSAWLVNTIANRKTIS